MMIQIATIPSIGYPILMANDLWELYLSRNTTQNSTFRTKSLLT